MKGRREAGHHLLVGENVGSNDFAIRLEADVRLELHFKNALEER
jgi:hypothetical protein